MEIKLQFYVLFCRKMIYALYLSRKTIYALFLSRKQFTHFVWKVFARWILPSVKFRLFGPLRGPAKFCSMRRILACLFVSSWWLAYLSHHDFLLAFLSHHRILILITHLHTDRHRCQLVDLEDSFPDCVDLPPYNCWIIVSRLTSLKNKKTRKDEKSKQIAHKPASYENKQGAPPQYQQRQCCSTDHSHFLRRGSSVQGHWDLGCVNLLHK